MLPALTALRVFILLAALPGTGQHLARLVKGAYVFWSGKKIAVIGPTASGKDSFIARLQGRQIPIRHATSPLGERVKSFDVRLALTRRQSVNITCKGVVNVGGDVEYRDDPSGWLSVCKGADVIFYVMTVQDLVEKRFMAKGRVRSDLEWLQAALPQLDENALVHVLINKIDEEIATHTRYEPFAMELAKELRALDRTAKRVLKPYEDRYTGATLISMKNKSMYTLAIHRAFRAVYSAFHEHESPNASSVQAIGAVT
ncbi:MAG TPA: GTPase domain-containing protein [Polyangiaceae bacterium]|nr:GTPase domain-containing protein [Polyangiaceae bacterium]